MSDGLEVLLCDNHLLAVVKPAGLPVVPDASGDESLLDRARAWIGREFQKPGRVFCGVVHRLDRPVSGVVLFARTSKAADRLGRQFRERTVTKVYWGLVEGVVGGEGGEVVQHLWKDAARNRVHARSAPGEGTREARTTWRRLGVEPTSTWLELLPHTGRSHQLRLACARGLGAPLLGDLKYGAARPLPDRSIALHARRLEVEHPTRGERLVLEAPAPALAVWGLARRAGGGSGLEAR